MVIGPLSPCSSPMITLTVLANATVAGLFPRCLQRRVTRLEEGMAHQMRGGEAMSSRRALSMGGGGAGGLLQGFGGGGRLVPPARHSTNVRQTTYHRWVSSPLRGLSGLGG